MNPWNYLDSAHWIAPSRCFLMTQFVWIAPLFGMAKGHLTEETLTKAVIGAFYEVYNNLGYGFFEHVYVLALEMELRARGLKVEREVWVPVYYKTVRIGYQRTDMLVEGRLVVEAKSTEKLPESASRKLYNYLHATKMKIGLLLHFGPKARFYPILYKH